MNLDNITKTERLKGGVYGLLIGDAVGVPYEFHEAADIPVEDLIDMVPPAGFQRAHEGVPCGTWSDDGAQALCLLDSLLEVGKFDLKDFADKLTEWWYHGYRAVDNAVFDIGVQTSQALMAYASGRPAEECGMLNPNGKGNGALMRVLPLALWHQGTDEELILDSQRQCLITHGAVTNQVCCAFYCLMARRLLSVILIPRLVSWEGWQESIGAIPGSRRNGSKACARKRPLKQP